MAKAVEVTFEETELGPARIATIFGVEGDELQARMRELAKAALEEYELALGERFPSTIKEQRELRLRLLYKHLPDELPTDEQIGELFQMTRPQVATLIAGTRARFGPEIEKRMKAAAVAALANASESDGDTVRIFAPDSLAKYMGDLISQTQAPPMEKLRDAGQTYDLRRDTIKALCKRLDVEPEAVVTVLDWS
ncbi:MAG TPA: hypothetical protein VFS54_11295 [Solirubrobacterales bacterium]|nr:hypothetical protein [Solirubrobacterales bacterium]